MLGTLDFAGSEYWTPFNFPYSTALGLSNDPGNKGSNFFCYGAICFSHAGILKKGQITK